MMRTIARGVHVLAVLVCVLSLSACPTSRTSERASISGRVVLQPEPGLDDISRVKVNLGRGEGDVTPDENGAFSITDLEPDTYEVTVTYAGGLTATASRSAYRPLRVRAVARAGADVNLGALAPQVATGSIAGRVQLPPDDDGSADGAQIRVVTRSGTVLQGTVAGTEFTIPDVPVGTHTITVKKDGYARAQMQQACDPQVRVEQEDEVAPAPTLGLAQARATLIPGGTEVRAVRGTTWFVQDAAPVTVRAFAGYALGRRAWRSGSLPPAYEDIPAQDNAWVLPTGDEDGGAVDGSHAWSFQFSDRCGYESPIYTLTLVRDSTAPALSRVSLNDGAAYATTRALRLVLDAADALSPSMEMAWTLCTLDATGTAVCPVALDASPWVPFAPLVAVPTAADGTWQVQARVRDLTGNVSAVLSDDIVVDATLPDLPSVIVGDGTRFFDPLATVQVTTAVDAQQMRVSETDVAAASWRPFEASFLFRFSPAEGDKEVFVQVRDAAGNTSMTGHGAARLVTSAVARGRVLLPGGGPAVGATVRALDGTAQFTTGDDGRWALTLQRGRRSVEALPPPVSGTQTLGPAGDTFDLDPGTDVTRPDLVLAELAGSLTGHVTLQGASDHSGTTVLISREPSGGSADVVVTWPDGTWQSRPLGVGAYRVVAQRELYERRDLGVHNVARDAVTAVPDTTLARLGGFAINGGAGYTRNPRVLLTLDAAGATECLVTDDPADLSFTAATRLGCGAGDVAFTLTGADGIKTVRVRVLASPPRDISSSIILDTVAPDLTASTLVLNDGAPFTRAVNVSMRMVARDATSGLSQMHLSNDDTAYTTRPYEELSVQPVPAPSQDGKKNFYVRLEDRAGNITTGRLSASIYLDTTPPTAGLVTVAGSSSPLVTDVTVGLELAATDTCDADFPGGCTGVTRPPHQVLVSARADYQGSDWRPYAANVVWFLGPADGDQDVYVKVRDQAGNEAAAPKLTVTLDRTPPGTPTLQLHGGLPVTDAHTVALLVTTQDVDTAGYTLELDGSLDPASQTYAWAARPATVTLSAGDGAKVVRARLRDLAGFTSALAEATVVVDTAAPTVLDFRVAGDVRFVTAPTGDTFAEITCADEPAGAGELELVIEDGVGGTPYAGPYLPAVPLRLAPPQGLKVLTATCRDAAGHASDPATADVVFDATPPTISALTLQGGSASGPAVAISAPSIEVTVAATDLISGTQAVSLSETAITSCTGQLFIYPTGTFGFTLSGGDGIHDLWACARDVAGNATAVPVKSTNSVELDTRAPEAPSLVLGNGSGWAGAAADVALSITPAETATGFRMQLAGDLAALRPEEAFQSTTTVNLAGGDGARTVSVVLLDRAGNPSPAAQATITLDTVAPTLGASVTVGSGSGYVRSATGATTVSSTCTDNLATGSALHLVVKEGSTTLLDTPWQPVLSLSLGGSPQGTRSLVLTCVDGTGRPSTPVNTSVSLDSVVPAITAFTVTGNGSGGFIRDPNVTVNLVAGDGTGSGVVDLAMSEGAFDCATASYGPWAGGPVGFAFSAGEGSKRVYACVRDRAGNTNATTATASTTVLVLDTTAPLVPSLTLAAWTGTATGVSLGISTTESTTGYMVLLSGDVVNVPAVPPAYPSTPMAIDLAAGDGAKTVQVRVRDPAGNVSDAAQATITLDTAAPTLGASVTVGSGSGYVRSATGATTVSSTCTDNLATGSALHLVVKEGSTTLLDTPWQPVLSLSLGGSPQGTRSLVLTCVDGTGRPSTPVNTSVSLDSVAPAITTFTVTGNGSGGFIRDPNVTVNLVAGDGTGSGVVDLAMSEGAFDCATASYGPWAGGPVGFAFSAGEGSKRVYACVRDRAGNTNATTATASTTVLVLDTTAPLVPSLTLAAWTGTATGVSLGISTTESTTGYVVLVSGDVINVPAVPPAYPSTPMAIDLAPGDGAKTVQVRVRDPAGNVSDAAQATITLDTVAPTLGASVTVGSGSGYVRSATGATTVSSTCTDNLATGSALHLVVKEGSTTLLDAPWQPVLSLSLGGSPQGTRSLVLTCVDGTGRPSTPVNTSVSLDSVAPAITTFTVTGNGSGGFIRDPNVTVNLVAGDGTGSGVVDLAMSEGAFDCATASYGPWAGGPVGFAFSAGEGSKRVYACVRDRAGNTNATTATASTTVLVLDTTAPLVPSLTLAAWTGTATGVSLGISTTEGTTGYVVLLSGDVVNVPAVPPAYPATPMAIDLAPGDGAKTVQVRLRDPAGNVSDAASEIITLDNGKPTVDSVAVGTDGFVTSPTGQASVAVTCTDALAPSSSLTLTALEVPAVGPDVLIASVAYKNPVTIGFGAAEGVRNLKFRCTDPAGKVSDDTATSQVAVRFDHTPPTINSFSIVTASPTNSRALSIALSTTGANRYAVSEASFSCAGATYNSVLPTTYTLQGGETSYTLYACAMDAAGNLSGTNATASGNSITLDLSPPAAGTLELAGGAASFNDVQVDIQVTGGQSPQRLLIWGALDGSQQLLFNWGSWPSTIRLSTGDGTKPVVAVIVDAAGNRSDAFGDSVTLDTQQPVVNNVILAEGLPTVNTRGIVVAITTPGPAVAPDTMAFWNGDSLGNCGSTPACGAGSYAPFAPLTIHTLSAGRGTKTVCWRFCDDAGNGTTPGSGTLQLDTYLPRPTPTLTSITVPANRTLNALPVSVLAGSASVTVTGAGIAYNTVVLFNELSAVCESSDPQEDCDAAVPGSCDTSCSVTVPDAVMRRAGTYTVRLLTPAPVEGTGTSSTVDFLNVVAPIPVITDVRQRGVVQSVSALGVPVAQSPVLTVCGDKFMDNMLFMLGPNVGQRTGSFVLNPPITSCPAGSTTMATVTMSTAGLFPADLEDEALTAFNPNGGSAVRPFGINPVAAECLPGVPCVSNLRFTRAPVTHGRGVRQGYSVVGSTLGGAASWRGGAVGGTVDAAGAQLTRVREQDAAGHLPLPFWSLPAAWLLEDRDALSPGVTLVRATYRGDGSLNPAAVINDGTGPRSMALGDLNEDGRPDLVFVDRSVDSMVVYIGTSFGFATRREYPTGATPGDVSMADFDMDGHVDVAVGNYSDASVTFRFGDGKGLFRDRLDIEVAGSNTCWASMAVDFNQDLIPDALCVSNGNALMGVAGRGDGTFGSPQTVVSGPSDGEALAAGDIDSDGFTDLVAAWGGAAPYYLTAHRGAANGTFTAVVEPNLVLSARAFHLTLGDVNADGLLDIVVANGAVVTVFLGKGNGAFAGGLNLLPAGASAVNRVRVADQNQDGWPDILAAADTADLHVFYGSAGGTFTDVGVTTSAGSVVDVAVTDASLDGVPDVVMLTANGIELRRGAAKRNVENAPKITDLLEHPTAAALADTNRDRRADALIGSSYADNVRNWLGQGNGSFTDSGNSYATHGGIAAVRVADFNNDGNADIITADTTNRVASVQLGNGTGAFAAQTDFTLGLGAGIVGPVDIAVGDLNGDTRPDFVTANGDSTTVSVRLNNGAGSFTVAASVGLGGGTDAAAVVLGDVNNNGTLDFAVIRQDAGNRANDRVLVYQGNGAGTFSWSATLDMGPRLDSLALVDMDRDGTLDVVVGLSNSGDDIAIRLGVGNGTFGALVPRPVRSGGNMIINDFNGDTYPDLLGSSFAIGYLEARLGLGPVVTTSLAPAVQAQTRTGDSFVFDGDINADGAPDLLFGNAYDQLTAQLLPAPGSVTQDLLPAAGAVTVAAGATANITIHQAHQHVDKVSLRVRLSVASGDLSKVQLTLQSPRGESLVVQDNNTGTACDPNLTGKQVWVASYPSTTATCAAFSLVMGPQREGDWTLVVDNTTGVTGVTVEDVGVVTHGSLRKEVPGSRPDHPERLVFPVAVSRRHVFGTTLGAPDNIDLPCAVTEVIDGNGNRVGGGEHFYEFSTRTPVTLDVRVTATFDAAVQVRSGACSALGPSLGCSDDNVGQNPTLTGVALGAGLQCLVIDGYSPNATTVHSGAFDLYMQLN